MADGRIASQKKIDSLIVFGLALAMTAAVAAQAQTADQAWLRYTGGHHAAIPASVRALGSDSLEQSAAKELERGISGLTGEQTDATPAKGETVVGTLDEVRKAFPALAVPTHLGPHGFWLTRTTSHGHAVVIVAGSNEDGALFGMDESPSVRPGFDSFDRTLGARLGARSAADFPG